ncbi:MAG: ABC transporter ATP-binding protein, partial [Stellaceae bacterium]
MGELLRIDHLSAGYGSAIVLNDVSVMLDEGQSLAVLGRNGAGKTSLIASIIGLTHRFSGTITFRGRDITRLSPERRAIAGIGWVPQERNIFRSLTVEENLTAVMRAGPWTLNRIYGLFPRLKERRANMGSQLSGGEQQMLAVGRALAVNPRLLLLDEPTEGLAPILVTEIQKVLFRIMHDEGISTLVVEQRPQQILN